MPSGIGLPEVIIVLVIALLIFGPKRLPDLGRSLGTGLREFKDSITGNSKDDDEPSEIAAAGADERTKPEPHDDAVSSSRG
jgi:sec-independent protein translocase protein TatA